MALKRKSPVVPKKVSKWNITPLVDGDTLIYKAGMAGQYTLTHIIEKGKRKPLISLRYKKDIAAWHEETGLVLGEHVRYQEEEVLEPIENILHTVKVILTDLEEHFGMKPIVYISGDGNYREDIATEKPYKGNRASPEQREKWLQEGKWLYWLGKTEKSYIPPQRPKHKQAIIEYLVKHWDAVLVENIEADDMLGIKQVEMGDKCIMIKEDKDLDMIPGWKYNPFKDGDKPYYVSETDGWRFFYRQLLTGDTTDNIPGLDGVGPARAKAIVTDEMEDPEEMLEAVKREYVNYYGSEASTKLNERGKLLWILRDNTTVWHSPIL